MGGDLGIVRFRGKPLAEPLGETTRDVECVIPGIAESPGDHGGPHTPEAYEGNRAVPRDGGSLGGNVLDRNMARPGYPPCVPFVILPDVDQQKVVIGHPARRFGGGEVSLGVGELIHVGQGISMAGPLVRVAPSAFVCGHPGRAIAFRSCGQPRGDPKESAT